ncbi:sex determination protein fruitless isoform X9 [Cydia amplana]|uniref:sex determination protein fruitless isoform X9 n=1 Tax=Cydia amplana TaxID=1869771 RepID=UPI002FE6A24C
MASDEQFSLCWNNFHANMSAGFHGLLSRGDLVDVTLAAEGRLLQAHKLVLSVCSPYFQEMFKMNPTQHPIVFLKDVSHSALRDLLQFMYQGEVNVKQEELASFISTAEQLQVKGLTGNQNEESSTPSKPKPTSRPGPRSSQQRQSVMTKLETDLDSKPSSTPVAIKRPNRPSIASNNSSSSQSGPVKRKCVDPLEAGPSGSAKEEFVTIPDEDENNAVAPKMEPEFVNESMWDDDDDGTNNDETNFGEDDSNMEMTGFDGSTTGDGNLTGGAEGGAVGDAQDHNRWIGTRRKMSIEEKRERKKLAERARLARIKSDPILLEQYRAKSRQRYYQAKAKGRIVPIREMPTRVQKRLRRRNRESVSKYRKKMKNNIVIKSVSSLVSTSEEIITP